MRFTIGMCPEPVLDDSVGYQNRNRSITYSTENGNKIVYISMCPFGDRCEEGLEVTLKMCPTGFACGCDYKVDDLGWEQNEYCSIAFRWTNPDQCVLHEIRLHRKSWWDSVNVLQSIQTRGGADPYMPVYPDGDIRNDDYCHECGISGPGQYLFVSQNLIPGQIYIISGYFHDQKCGGASVKHELGYVLYQTTGFTSGYILSKVSSDPPRYSVRYYVQDGNDIELRTATVYATDYTAYDVGDSVMIAKKGADFPSPDNVFLNELPTHDNVEQVSSSSMYIVPYNKVTG